MKNSELHDFIESQVRQGMLLGNGSYNAPSLDQEELTELFERHYPVTTFKVAVHIGYGTLVVNKRYLQTKKSEQYEYDVQARLLGARMTLAKDMELESSFPICNADIVEVTTRFPEAVSVDENDGHEFISGPVMVTTYV